MAAQTIPQSLLSGFIDDTLSVPQISDKRVRAVGSFILAWGIVERELDIGFPVLFRTDPTLAACISANLGTKAKLDILLSATQMLSSELGTRLTARAKTVLDRISDHSDKARNTLAHGQLLAFGGSADDAKWEIARQVARRAHKIVLHPMDARYWNTQAKIAIQLAQEWRKQVARIHSKIAHLTLTDLEAICKTQIQVSAPSPARRRKNLPPRKHELAGRPASVAKWPRT